MRTVTYDCGRQERTVLAGMITDRTVLANVSPHWDGQLFSSRWGNLIGSWAVRHFRKYHKPPGRLIVNYFDKWSQSAKDKETISMIDSFLSSLSREYERNGHAPPPEYVLDLARSSFNGARLKSVAGEVEALIEKGEIEKAEAKIRDFRRVEIGRGAGIDLLSDKNAVRMAFQDLGDNMIRFDQPSLDSFFSNALVRDSFIGIMGKEKSGKSFWLQEIAWQALLNGLKVAFFEVGDQSQSQIMRRFAGRASEKPIRVDDVAVRVPSEFVSTSPLEVNYKDISYSRPLTWKESVAAFLRLSKKVEGRIRLSVHPNSSISVHGIQAILDDWAREDFVPSVVVVDYADILAPINGKADTRDQINATWKALRALSQQYHCFVLTATQTDADSYNKTILSRENFSEDKRKYAHVTGMLGINQTDREKEAQVCRLNWILLRDLEFSETKCVYIGQCLALANPAVCSSF